MPNMMAGRVSVEALLCCRLTTYLYIGSLLCISVVQEAVCTGDANILTAILEVRDLQRHIQRVTHVPKLLQKLVDAPDFYVEMKWEFTSWGKWCANTSCCSKCTRCDYVYRWRLIDFVFSVPLMSRLCPSDVYKVYKRGSNVRIDTTLLGFDHTTWQRGDRSYIFKGQCKPFHPAPVNWRKAGRTYNLDENR